MDEQSLKELFETKINSLYGNVEAQKEYFQSKLDAIDKALTLARELTEIKLKSAEAAVELARQTMDKRLDGMNEFRDALRDQSTKFVTMAEHEIMRGEVRELRESRAELKGKASQMSVILSYGLGLISTFVAILAMITNRGGVP